MNFKNDALCKTYAAVFKLMVQTYVFCRSNQSNLFTPQPQRYKLLPPQGRGDHIHVAYFCKVKQINSLVFLTLVIYFLFNLSRNRYTISFSLLASRAITSISKQELLKILKLKVKDTTVCALNYSTSVCRKKCHLKSGEFFDSSQFLCLNDKKF